MLGLGTVWLALEKISSGFSSLALHIESYSRRQLFLDMSLKIDDLGRFFFFDFRFRLSVRSWYHFSLVFFIGLIPIESLSDDICFRSIFGISSFVRSR